MNKWVRKNLKHFLMLTPFFFIFSVFFLYPILKRFLHQLLSMGCSSPSRIGWPGKLHQRSAIELFRHSYIKFVEIRIHHRAARDPAFLFSSSAGR